MICMNLSKYGCLRGVWQVQEKLKRVALVNSLKLLLLLSLNLKICNFNIIDKFMFN